MVNRIFIKKFSRISYLAAEKLKFPLFRSYGRKDISNHGSALLLKRFEKAEIIIQRVSKIEDLLNNSNEKLFLKLN